MDTEQAIAAAWHGEEALLRPGTRRDRDALQALLAPGFREIGQSGRLWARAEIIDALVASEDFDADQVMSERHAERLAPGLVLLTYRLEFARRISRRSSLWRVHDGAASLVFHQGTALPG